MTLKSISIIEPWFADDDTCIRQHMCLVLRMHTLYCPFFFSRFYGHAINARIETAIPVTSLLTVMHKILNDLVHNWRYFYSLNFIALIDSFWHRARAVLFENPFVADCPLIFDSWNVFHATALTNSSNRLQNPNKCIW